MHKSIVYVFVLAMLAVGYAEPEAAYRKPEHDVPCETPLKTVYTVVPDFPKTDFCGRTCYSKFWMGDGNTRYVQFTGTLKPNECARDFCYCMYDYMNQGDWLHGVGAKCYHQCNNVTLVLNGQPDPTYTPCETDPKLARPLQKLKAVLDQFKNKADLVGLVCTTKTATDACGCIHCLLECPKKGDRRCKEELCKGIRDYFNQGNKLDDSITLCNERGDTLEVEFIGNTEAGSKCKAEPFFKY